MLQPSTSPERLAQRQRAKIAAALCWLGAGAGGVFLLATAVSGRLTISNLLVIAVAIISLSAFGLLVLSGDFAWNPRALDEGQVAASHIAQSLAFNIGYLGVIGLWISYLLVPAWAANATVHLGVLALVITCLWFGVWVWQRWQRP